MCGIVGYLGNEHYDDFVLDGLRYLLNRGYDSVGISTIQCGAIQTIKHASNHTYDALDKVENEVKTFCYESKCSIGIGHTRWATHGSKTTINAHPHSDNGMRISLVHNGIIENYQELKQGLILGGYQFHSQTDTEVIAVLIGKHLDDGMDIHQAIETTVSQLSGTWALVIMHCDFPNKLWMTRNGSPLLLGLEEEFVMVASEQIAFGNHIHKYIILENHDIIEVSKESKKIQYNKNIHRYPIKMKNNVKIDIKPEHYQHWMIKEIMEQPDAVMRAMNNGGRILNNNTVKLGGFDNIRSELSEMNHMILLGCGTSYHAGLWSLSIFKSLDIFDTVSIYDGAEFTAKDVPRYGKTCVVFLSQSGETKDLHRCIDISKEMELLKIGVVNVVDSMIARETDCGIYLNAGREVSVASTKSFTNQCVILSMIAIWFSQLKNTCMDKRNGMIKDLRILPFHIQNVLDGYEELVEKFDTEGSFMSSMCKDARSLFLLGKGSQEAIAKEGALKIKEVTYIHAEGYSSSSLKHGTFALIENKIPIVILDIGDEYRDKTQNAFQEVLTRGADVLLIRDMEVLDVGGCLLVDKNKTFGGLLANVYLQLISYLISVRKGYNPDYPRNLAKVVTVE
jgi:glucosamine--fructose-6-phosphate aminotransferase (isomerizing)